MTRLTDEQLAMLDDAAKGLRSGIPLQDYLQALLDEVRAGRELRRKLVDHRDNWLSEDPWPESIVDCGRELRQLLADDAPAKGHIPNAGR